MNTSWAGRVGLWLGAFSLALSSCHTSTVVEKNVTGIDLTVTYTPRLQLDQLEIVTTFGSEVVVAPTRVPSTPRALKEGGEGVAILLRDELAGSTVSLTVTGLAQGTPIITLTHPVVVVRQMMSQVTLALDIACLTASDCQSPGPCEVAADAQCELGRCLYAPKTQGETCEAIDLCVLDDACDGQGHCVGATLVCNEPPPDECAADNTVYRTYADLGTCIPATGQCSYTPTDLACANCLDACLAVCAGITCTESHGGCQSNGICVPGEPPSCDYDLAAPLSPCDLAATIEPDQDGVCVDGACVECDTAADCRNPPNGPLACFNTACIDTHCDYTVIPTATCDPGGCRDGMIYVERPCGADGACPATSTTSCNGYQCDVNATDCRTSCSDDSQCAAGYFCVAPSCEPLRNDGASCTGLGDHACSSGHCEGSLCCSGGDCCNDTSDCPTSYSAAPTCTDASGSTNCQGTRQDATCSEHVCGSLIVDDDRGCDGAMHLCTSHVQPVACLNAMTQPEPVCPTTCAVVGCETGYVCQDPSCSLRSGTGETCTGSGQGSCATGLKCENSVCCDAAGTTCCAQAAQCSNGLMCNVAAAACFDSCTNYTSTRCAAANNYCYGNACIPKKSNGMGCTTGAECQSTYCSDGVCCEAACTDTCASCLTSLTNENDGLCRPIKLGSTDSAPAALCTGSGAGCTAGSCACDGVAVGTEHCRAATGQLCASDAFCTTNICDCADTQCSTHKCASAACGVCAYTSTGSSCVGGLGAPGPVEDPRDCATTRACYSGTCLLNDTQSCTLNSQCAHTCIGSACAPLAGTRGVCDAGDSADCLAGRTCTTGLCLLNNGQGCTTNNQCLEVCVQTTCMTRADTGGSCDETADCLAGNSCVGNICKRDNGQSCTTNSQCVNVCISGTCAATAATGGTCDETPDCQANHTCTGGTCKRNNGQSCTLNSQCVDVCIAGSCAAKSTATGACDETADCQTGNTCQTNVCRLNDGQACVTNAQCLHTCIGSACAPVSGDGGTCDETADCLTGRSCITSICQPCRTRRSVFATPGKTSYLRPTNCAVLNLWAYGAGGGGGTAANMGGGGGGGASAVERTSDATRLVLGGGGGGGGGDATYNGGGGGGGLGSLSGYTAAASESYDVYVGGAGTSACSTGPGAGGAYNGGGSGVGAVAGTSIYGGGGGNSGNANAGNSTYGGGGGDGGGGDSGSSTYGGAGGEGDAGSCGTSTSGGACSGWGAGGGGGMGATVMVGGTAAGNGPGGAAANGGPGYGAPGGATCGRKAGDGWVIIEPVASPDAYVALATVGQSTWVVPAGVTHVDVEVFGAGGGAGNGNSGGGGGGASAAIRTSNSSVLALAGGGGGGGRTAGSSGAGGGGGYALATSVTTTPGESLTIYIGGGGVSGCSNIGGSGGNGGAYAGGTGANHDGVAGTGTSGGGGGGGLSAGGANSSYGGAGGSEYGGPCGSSTFGGACNGAAGGGGGGTGTQVVLGAPGSAATGGLAAGAGPGNGANIGTCSTVAGSGRVVIWLNP